MQFAVLIDMFVVEHVEKSRPKVNRLYLGGQLKPVRVFFLLIACLLLTCRLNAQLNIDATQTPGADMCAKISAAFSALPNAAGTVDARGFTGQQVCAAANATTMLASANTGRLLLGNLQLYLPLSVSIPAVLCPISGSTVCNSGAQGNCTSGTPCPGIPPQGTVIIPTGGVTLVGVASSPTGGNAGDTEFVACLNLNSPITGCVAPVTREWTIAKTVLCTHSNPCNGFPLSGGTTFQNRPPTRFR